MLSSVDQDVTMKCIKFSLATYMIASGGSTTMALFRFESSPLIGRSLSLCL